MSPRREKKRDQQSNFMQLDVRQTVSVKCAVGKVAGKTKAHMKKADLVSTAGSGKNGLCHSREWGGDSVGGKRKIYVGNYDMDNIRHGKPSIKQGTFRSIKNHDNSLESGIGSKGQSVYEKGGVDGEAFLRDFF